MIDRKDNLILKTVAITIVILIMTCGLPCMLVNAGTIETCKMFYLPFKVSERHAYLTFQKRCTGSYGEYRRTRVAGHRHAGVDLRGSAGEQVFAVGVGRVAYRYWLFPNETVAIEHRLPGGEKIYSVYTHIADIGVNPDDPVDENTMIGRLFNAGELKKARFSFPHVHFEIRKSMEDMGRSSYTSMSKKELDQFCIDPRIFFRSHLK